MKLKMQQCLEQGTAFKCYRQVLQGVYIIFTVFTPSFDRAMNAQSLRDECSHHTSSRNDSGIEFILKKSGNECAIIPRDGLVYYMTKYHYHVM